MGATVVRALEHAGRRGLVRPGEGLATQRIGSGTLLRVVDAILSGTHEAGNSHYELMRAFTDDDTLQRMTDELNSHAYRTHEFGDSVMMENVRAMREERALSRAVGGQTTLGEIRSRRIVNGVLAQIQPQRSQRMLHEAFQRR